MIFNDNNERDDVTEPKKKGAVTVGLPSWMQGGGAIIFGAKRPANLGDQVNTQVPQEKKAEAQLQVNNKNDLTSKNTDQDDK